MSLSPGQFDPSAQPQPAPAPQSASQSPAWGHQPVFDPYEDGAAGQTPAPYADPYPQYGQNPYGQSPYVQNPYAQNPYVQNPYVQAPNQHQQMAGYGDQQYPYGYPGAFPQAPLVPYGGQPSGPVGQIRSTGTVVLLSLVTFGIYGLYWYYVTHEEMKQHTGEGLGGAVALIMAVLGVSFVLSFTMPDEISKMYARRGMQSPVSAITGLWAVLGWMIIIGPLVWLVQVNSALNDYWRSQGAQG